MERSQRAPGGRCPAGPLHRREAARVAAATALTWSGAAPMLGGAAAHKLLDTFGGSIGQALPVTLGVAIACPDRLIVTISGDGSVMRQGQSLRTMARKRFGATVLIVSSGGFGIPNPALVHLGLPRGGQNASAVFDLTGPGFD